MDRVCMHVSFMLVLYILYSMNGAQIHSLTKYTDGCVGLAVDQNGDLPVACSSDKCIRIF